jgi:hypothetical protein
VRVACAHSQFPDRSDDERAAPVEINEQVGHKQAGGVKHVASRSLSATMSKLSGMFVLNR